MMRHNPAHAERDEEVVRRLIAENPWATVVSANGGGLVASHYPVLLDEGEDLAVVTHVGRPDERVHGFGEEEILIIVAGPHGYISPSWYGEGATRAPTWNFAVAHCYGIPQILSAEENVRTLERLVEHFERHVADPVLLEPETADRLAPGTVGIRVEISRWTCKVKMSQDKDHLSQRQVLAALRGDGPYANNRLADEMELSLSRKLQG